MLQGLGSYGTSSSDYMSMRFKKLDTNSDNSLDRTEFIAGAPDGVSSDQAGKLFDKLDSKGTGALSQSDLTTAFQQMASSMQSSLLQAQESQSSQTTQAGQDSDGDNDGSTQSTGHHHHHGGPDPAKMFSKLDSNGDGSVTKDEFVAGRPDDISEDQAGAFFDKIAANSGADSSASGLTKDQFAAGLEKSRPDKTATAQSSTSSTDDQTNQLIDQLLALISSQLSSSSSSGGQTGQSGDQGPPDPAKMFAALDTNHDGTVSKDEFLAGRPSQVSKDQAGAFYDKIASASGADGTTGLSQDQLAEGMKKAGPPDNAQATTESQTSTLASNTNLLLQDLLKAISSYQKANLASAANTTLAA